LTEKGVFRKETALGMLEVPKRPWKVGVSRGFKPVFSGTTTIEIRDDALVSRDEILVQAAKIITEQKLASHQKGEEVKLRVFVSEGETKEKIEEILKIDYMNDEETTLMHRVDSIQKGLMRLIYLTDAEEKEVMGYILYQPKEGNLAHFRRTFISTRDKFRQKGLLESLVLFSMDRFDGIMMRVMPDEYEAGFIDEAAERKLENLANMCYRLGFKSMTTGGIASELYWIKPDSNNAAVIIEHVDDIVSTQAQVLGFTYSGSRAIHLEEISEIIQKLRTMI
jgi:predicted GNAT family acetyltransferase